MGKFTPKYFYEIDPLGLYYKTFYGRNLYIFVMRMFIPGKPFHHSLMFVGKAGAYLSEPEMCFTQVGSGLTCKY
jgi:hypothetical protein